MEGFSNWVEQGLLPLEVTKKSGLMRKIIMEKEKKFSVADWLVVTFPYWNARLLGSMEAQSKSHQKTATRLSEFTLNCLVFVNAFTPQIWLYWTSGISDYIFNSSDIHAYVSCAKIVIF